VQHRIHDEELGFFAREQAFERREIGTIHCPRHAHDTRAERGEARKHHEPCRILDEHRVARREEAARDQVDGLGGTGGSEDLLG
jgi:hypothetical protein